MNDLISRQAAIDALGDEPEVWTGKDEYAQGLIIINGIMTKTQY